MTDEQEMILRELLWLRHGHSIWELYGDDGEMQCHNCMLDFKRDSVEKIKERFDQIAFDKMCQAMLDTYLSKRTDTAMLEQKGD